MCTKIWGFMCCYERWNGYRSRPDLIFYLSMQVFGKESSELPNISSEISIRFSCMSSSCYPATTSVMGWRDNCRSLSIYIKWFEDFGYRCALHTHPRHEYGYHIKKNFTYTSFAEQIPWNSGMDLFIGGFSSKKYLEVACRTSGELNSTTIYDESVWYAPWGMKSRHDEVASTRSVSVGELLWIVSSSELQKIGSSPISILSELPNYPHFTTLQLPYPFPHLFTMNPKSLASSTV